jgi:hypothetical protein
MTSRIAGAIAAAAKELMPPLLVSAGLAVGLAAGPRAFPFHRRLATALAEPTPEPAPAQPTVIVVPAPAGPQALAGGPAVHPPRTMAPGVDPAESLRPLVIRSEHASEWIGVVDISRSELDRLLEQSSELMAGVRVVPYQVDDRPVGFRLYGIRSGSALAALGLVNGDVVRSVNGMPLAEPDSALEAYSKLRSADYWDFGLTRRGRPARLVVLIRDEETG